MKICLLTHIRLRRQGGKWRPIEYQSKTMAAAGCNYDVHNKGSGQHFKVSTDDLNLIRFTTTKTTV